MSKDPLVLSAYQQNMMAELMMSLSTFVYNNHKGAEPESELEWDLADWIEKFDVDSSKIGELYDKFHRTGANR